MSSPPVHWYEGMFLRPHHFQAADRHWAAELAAASQLDLPFAYGVRKLEIDDDGLKAFRFRVTQLSARLRDGTVVRLPDDGPLNELNLEGPLAQAAAVDVCLAVPVRLDGGRNVGTPTPDQVPRYRIDNPAGGVPDDNSGERPAPVQFRKLNMRLLVDTPDVDLGGSEILRLARVVRRAQDAKPTLDPLYVPPLLALDGYPGVRQHILDPLFNSVAEQLLKVGAEVRNQDLGPHDPDPETQVQYDQLRVLNEAYATFLHLRTPGLHPVDGHRELLRLAGLLSVYGARRTFPDVTTPDIYTKAFPEAADLPPKTPADLEYSHDQLGVRLTRLKLLLDYLLKMLVAVRKFEKRAFVGLNLMMQVAMEKTWLAGGSNLYVSVTSNLMPEVVRNLLQAGNTNFKLAADRRVEEVYQRGLRGLEFSYVPEPPKPLTPGVGETFYEVTRTAGEWEHVEASGVLALRLNHRLLAPPPPGEPVDPSGNQNLTGRRDLALRGTAGTSPSLWFTLYVVPRRR